MEADRSVEPFQIKIGGLQAGWEHVEGVELTEEYIPIAEARIKYWLDKKEADSKQLNLV